MNAISLNPRAHFLKDLADLLNLGLSLKDALALIQHLPEQRSRRLASSTQRGLSEGQTLAQSLSPWFKPSIIGLIRAGEASQRLAHALELASKASQEEQQLLGACMQRLSYPIVILILALILLVVINHMVLEPFLSFLPLTHWPDAARQIYHSANWLKQYGLMSVMSLILCIIGFTHALGHWCHPLRRHLDTWPLWRLYRQAQASYFLSSLSVMSEQGIALKEALNLLSMNATPYAAEHLQRMQTALASGKTALSDVLNTGLFDAEAIARLCILGKGQHWGKALKVLSQQTQSRYENSIRRLAQFIAGFCLILTALTAAQIIFGIYALGSQAAIS
jgi:type II secretory pathway component PulF